VVGAPDSSPGINVLKQPPSEEGVVRFMKENRAGGKKIFIKNKRKGGETRDCASEN